MGLQRVHPLSLQGCCKGYTKDDGAPALQAQRCDSQPLSKFWGWQRGCSIPAASLPVLGREGEKGGESRAVVPCQLPPAATSPPPPASPPSHPAASQKANVSTHPSSQGDGNVEAIALGKAATVSQKQLFGLSATQAPQHSCLPSPALTPSHPDPQQPPGPHYVGTPPSQWDDTQHSLSSPSGMLREGEHLHPTQPMVGTPHHHFMAQGVGCSCAAQPAPPPPPKVPPNEAI